MSNRRDLADEFADEREMPRADELSNDADVTLDEPDTLASPAEAGDEETETPPSPDQI